MRYRLRKNLLSLGKGSILTSEDFRLSNAYKKGLGNIIGGVSWQDLYINPEDHPEWFEKVNEDEEQTTNKIEPLSLSINDYLDGHADEDHRVKLTQNNIDNLWWRTNKIARKINEMIDVLNSLKRKDSK